MTLQADGSFDYVPDPDFAGSDSFTYQASDGVASDGATVVLEVTATNDDPIARNDTAATSHATPILIDVLANDSDIDGDRLTVTAVGTPSSGTATIVSNQVRCTPPAGFSGSATFVSHRVGWVGDGYGHGHRGRRAAASLPHADPDTDRDAGTHADASAGGHADAGPHARPLWSPRPHRVRRRRKPSRRCRRGVAERVPDSISAPHRRRGRVPARREATARSLPWPQPQVTTSFRSQSGDFALAALFQGFGGSFAWAMPAAILGVPGLLFILAVAGQLLGAAAWIPRRAGCSPELAYGDAGDRVPCHLSPRGTPCAGPLERIPEGTGGHAASCAGGDQGWITSTGRSEWVRT